MSCFCFPIFNLFVDVRIVLWIQTKVLRPAFIDGRTALRLTPAVCHSVQPQLSSTLLCFHGIPKDKALKKRWAGQIRWDDFTITKQKSAVDTFEEQKPCRASSSIFQNMCDKGCSPGALAFSLGMERATKLKHFPERWSPCLYQTFKTLLCTFQHSTGDNNVYVIHMKTEESSRGQKHSKGRLTVLLLTLAMHNWRRRKTFAPFFSVNIWAILCTSFAINIGSSCIQGVNQLLHSYCLWDTAVLL